MIEKKFAFWNNTSLDDDIIERFVQKTLKIVLENAYQTPYDDFYGSLEIRLQDDLEDKNVSPIFQTEFVSGSEPADSYTSGDPVKRMTIRFGIYSVLGRRGADFPFKLSGQIEISLKYFNGKGFDPSITQLVYEGIWKEIKPFLKEDDCFINARWVSEPSKAALPSDVI